MTDSNTGPQGQREHVIEVVGGPSGHGLYINDYRVAGAKPWGGGNVKHSWRVSDADLAGAGLVRRAPTQEEGEAKVYPWSGWIHRRNNDVLFHNGEANEGDEFAVLIVGDAALRMASQPTPPSAEVERLDRLEAYITHLTNVNEWDEDTPLFAYEGMPTVADLRFILAALRAKL